MLKTIEGFEPVVQAFFSPDPEDAILIRETLSSTARFGITMLDLPTLHCWLRARVNHAWQPPTELKVKPLKRPNPERISALIRDSNWRTPGRLSARRWLAREDSRHAFKHGNASLPRISQ